MQRQAFVQTASGQSLDDLAVIAGLTRYPASAAVRLGVFNAAVAIGARFSTINGENSINFIVTAADTPEDPEEGFHYYQLTAETAGTIGNEYTGPILPITAIPRPHQRPDYGHSGAGGRHGDGRIVPGADRRGPE